MVIDLNPRGTPSGRIAAANSWGHSPTVERLPASCREVQRRTADARLTSRGTCPGLGRSRHQRCLVSLTSLRSESKTQLGSDGVHSCRSGSATCGEVVDL